MGAREPRYFLEINGTDFPCHLGRALWWHDRSSDRKALDEIDAGDVVFHYVARKVDSGFLKEICGDLNCHRSMIIMRSRVKRVDRGTNGSGFDANDLRSKLNSVLGGVLGRGPCAGMDLDGYLDQELYREALKDPHRLYFMAELEDARPFTRELRDLGLSSAKLRRYLVRLEGDLAGPEGTGPARDLKGAIEVLRRSADERGLVLDEGLLRRVLVAAWRGNVLLTGPPGSGKSTLAELVAAALGDERPLRATANALWFRRDVIGGSTLRNGGESWRSGLFIRAFNRAAEGDGLRFLLIDELNRADVDKAFGDFFTIFRSPDSERWEFPAHLAEEILSYCGPAGGGRDPCEAIDSCSEVDEEARKFLRAYCGHRKELDELNGILRRVRVIATANLVDVRTLFLVGEAAFRRFSTFDLKYPDGAEDLERFLRRHRLDSKLSEKDRRKISEMVELLRKVRDEECRDVRVSPAAVENAVMLMAATTDLKDPVREFREYLRASIGPTGGEKLTECLKKAGWREEARAPGGEGGGGKGAGEARP
ncbi:MAG: AAA family ATPase [Nitrososphaeria archaeon]